jgi:hypothetical protein
MKNRRFAALVAVVLFCFIGWSAYAQGQRSNPVRQTWEYRVMSISGQSAEGTVPQMNQLGTDGWELVNMVIDSSGGRPYYLYYFKRPK